MRTLMRTLSWTWSPEAAVGVAAFAPFRGAPTAQRSAPALWWRFSRRRCSASPPGRATQSHPGHPDPPSAFQGLMLRTKPRAADVLVVRPSRKLGAGRRRIPRLALMRRPRSRPTIRLLRRGGRGRGSWGGCSARKTLATAGTATAATAPRARMEAAQARAAQIPGEQFQGRRPPRAAGQPAATAHWSRSGRRHRRVPALRSAEPAVRSPRCATTGNSPGSRARPRTALIASPRTLRTTRHAPRSPAGAVLAPTTSAGLGSGAARPPEASRT
mmetsp:Transcript_65178/g.187630  ORF Transcript_65178/g.187630 Transcript_65178/m.187630 type:complete len:272 (-) Transcript_65178:185-1000(-)